jgi:regulator of sigma E protease
VGIQVGDAITAVNDRAVAHYYEFVAALKDKPEQIVLDINRNGEPKRFTLVLLWPKDGEPETGIAWQTRLVTVKGTGFLDSAKAGFSETVNIARLTVKSIGLFFKGVDVTEAVSGPVRITLLIGEVAQTGFASSAELLGIICISLFLMNLLPVPLLDGGLILFSLIEIVLRKPLKPKTQYYVQFIGIAFMLLLFSIAMFGDIRYLTR